MKGTVGNRRSDSNHPVFHVLTARGDTVCNNGTKTGVIIDVDLVPGYWVTFEDAEGKRFRMCSFCQGKTDR